MPAKNLHPDAVVAALKADGWTITDDPLSLKVGQRNLQVDLGAERLPIGAEPATASAERPRRCDRPRGPVQFR